MSSSATESCDDKDLTLMILRGAQGLFVLFFLFYFTADSRRRGGSQQEEIKENPEEV